MSILLGTKAVKEIYIGANGKPRKVKEGYVGVGGVARRFYSALPAKDTLENTSWADIQTIAKTGIAADYWNVGDIKSIQFNDMDYCAQIIGFDHDDVADAESYGRDKAGITFQFGAANDKNNPGLYSEYRMSNDGINAGGWEESTMRQYTMKTMKSYFQADVQDVITQVKKVTGKGGRGNTIVTTCLDDLWLPSVVELTGKVSYSVEGEGTQYQFYKGGGSLIRYPRAGNVAKGYWTRSASPGDAVSYASVQSDGSILPSECTDDYPITFCFCV